MYPTNQKSNILSIQTAEKLFPDNLVLTKGHGTRSMNCLFEITRINTQLNDILETISSTTKLF